MYDVHEYQYFLRRSTIVNDYISNQTVYGTQWILSK